MNNKINIDSISSRNGEIPVTINLDKGYKKYIAKGLLFLAVGCLFWLCLYGYSLSQSKEDKALLDYKEAIHNLDSNTSNRYNKIKEYQKLIDLENKNIENNGKLKEKYKKEIEKIVNKFDIIGLFVPRTYAEEKKKPEITYDNLKIEGKDKPPFLLYSRLKDECYAQKVNNKKHCIKTGLSIAYAESSWKDLQTPFGLKSKDKSYKKWVKSYKKYWYKAQDGFFFYGDADKLGPSHYCKSEESSGSDVGCPNGRKNFNAIFFNLTF